MQVSNNFIWYAPDASQAPWARTALLYWTEPATTSRTPIQCARVAAQMPPHGASAFFAIDSPVLRWYLRALAPAATAEGATAIVGSVEQASLSQAQGLTTYEFELSDTWYPAWRSLSPPAALHYLLERNCMDAARLASRNDRRAPHHHGRTDGDFGPGRTATGGGTDRVRHSPARKPRLRRQRRRTPAPGSAAGNPPSSIPL